MEERESAVEEQHGERGLLHLWKPGLCSVEVCPDRPLLPRPVLQAALGSEYGLLLVQGGVVYSIGVFPWRRRSQSVGVCGPVLEVRLGGQTVVRVAAGPSHCGVVTEVGGVYMWGDNTAGQCGPIRKERRQGQPDASASERGCVFIPHPSPVRVVDVDLMPPSVVRLVELACGREHTLALSAQGEVWAWGSGCQLGLVTKTSSGGTPCKVEHLVGRHVIQVACGDYHSLALVQRLLPQNCNTQNPSQQPRQSQPTYRTKPEWEGPAEVDHAQYCPLGVELVNVTPNKGNTGSPRTRLVGRSPAPFSLRLDGQANPSTQTESRRRACPLANWRANRSFPDEVELRYFLNRLSSHSLEEKDVNHTTGSEVANQTSDVEKEVLEEQEEEKVEKEEEEEVLEEQEEEKVEKEEEEEVLEEQEEEKVEKEEEEEEEISSLADASKQESPEDLQRPGSSPGTARPQGSDHTHTSSRRPARGNFPQAGRGQEPRQELPYLGTEVWSWGRGSEGQLGHGDHLHRLQPLCIESLAGEEVVKITTGSHHSLALTAQSEVYSWGSNRCGQLGHDSLPVTVPHKAQLSGGFPVWDVSAGDNHSLLLADGDCVQPILFYCGQQQGSSGGQGSHTPRPLLLPFTMEMGYIHSVYSGGGVCGVVSDRTRPGSDQVPALHRLSSRERQQNRLLKQTSATFSLLLRTEMDGVCVSLGELCAGVCERLARLSDLTGRHASSLSNFLRDISCHDVTSLPLLAHTHLFREAYKEYSSSLGNFQVMGGFQDLSVDWLKARLTSLGVVFGESSPPDLQLWEGLLYQPLDHLLQYSQTLLSLASSYQPASAEYRSLYQACSHYEFLSLSLRRRRNEAESTLLFWRQHPAAAALRLSGRRLLCHSADRSVSLQNARRFSNHCFTLFNDVLVHTQSSSLRVYPLSCLWVQPVTEAPNGLVAIKVTTPEESFTLVTSTTQDRNHWLQALYQAVDGALGTGGQRSLPRLAVAMAISRSASYTFKGEGRLRGALYTGTWLAGRMHGRGTLKWPDGRSYSGSFRDGLEDGYGESVLPNEKLGKPDCYHGHWRDGQVHGYGTYRYASGEVYEGCFHDGQRNGYGMLKSSRLAKATSSIFIGQWVHDKKTGYGVSDDITRGEKYIGEWQGDQRQGVGVLLTQSGLYYQGSFRDHCMAPRMQQRYTPAQSLPLGDYYSPPMAGSGRAYTNNLHPGQGLLVTDDNTSFRGEFSEDWTINGKGLLCLPSGEVLEGVFSGRWGEDLKVSGTLSRPLLPRTGTRRSSRRSSSILPDWSYQGVFEECLSRLGCTSRGKPDQQTAWDHIAVTMTTGRRESPDLSRSQSRLLEGLEVIPQHGEPITASAYDNICRYLAKACATPLHPLGWLLETLVMAYRVTYVGVGCHPQLLHQAIAELQSNLHRILSVVRILFPGLPEEGGSISSSVCVVSSSTLLLSLLLPRVYPILFSLYCQGEGPQHALYWQHTTTLNLLSDQSLLSFLGVNRRFWPVSVSVLGEIEQVTSSTTNHCFSSAVEMLQQIGTVFTPSDKLQVIQRSFKTLTQEVKSLLGISFLWSMDDLFPLFLYVVLRARIRYLGAEVGLITDFMDPELIHGELGLMFTTLEACYLHIQQDDHDL